MISKRLLLLDDMVFLSPERKLCGRSLTPQAKPSFESGSW
jgi:hypothetical protein